MEGLEIVKQKEHTRKFGHKNFERKVRIESVSFKALKKLKF